MHQAGKLLRAVLRDKLKTFVPQSCTPGVLQLKLCLRKPLSSVDRSWLLGSKCKLQGSSQPTKGGKIQGKRVLSPFSEGLKSPFSSFSFLEFLRDDFGVRAGASVGTWILGLFICDQTHPEDLLSVVVCEVLWGVCTCSAWWPELGLTCQDLKNSNLKNFVKNKYLGGGGRC